MTDRDVDDDELRLGHEMGCGMEPRPHVHVIRLIRRVPRVDVADLATTYQPDGQAPLVIDRPPAGALEMAGRLPSPARPDIDDAPAGAGHAVEADRG